MALIVTREGKKVIIVTETEMFGVAHISMVTNALGAFADEKDTIHGDSLGTKDPNGFTPSQTITHRFGYNRQIPTKVLKNALDHLQVKLEK